MGLDWRVQEVEEKEETSRSSSPTAETHGHGHNPADGVQPGGWIDLHAAAAVR
jgi:hypothetical protein